MAYGHSGVSGSEFSISEEWEEEGQLSGVLVTWCDP